MQCLNRMAEIAAFQKVKIEPQPGPPCSPVSSIEPAFIGEVASAAALRRPFAAFSPVWLIGFKQR
jgi:hypothetical protein